MKNTARLCCVSYGEFFQNRKLFVRQGNRYGRSRQMSPFTELRKSRLDIGPKRSFWSFTLVTEFHFTAPAAALVISRWRKVCLSKIIWSWFQIQNSSVRECVAPLGNLVQWYIAFSDREKTVPNLQAGFVYMELLAIGYVFYSLII